MQIRILAPIILFVFAAGGASAAERTDLRVSNGAADRSFAKHQGSKGTDVAQDECMKNSARKCCYDGSGRRVCK